MHNSSANLYFNTEVGATYDISFKAAVQGDLSLMVADIRDENGSSFVVMDQVEITSTNMQSYHFRFIATGTDYRMKFYRYDESVGVKIFTLDDVVIDKKTPISGAKILAYSDYYPFGMKMVGRYGFMGNTRHGYQGEWAEFDSETGWDYFQARHYNAGLARWMSPDPVNNFNTPYASMFNNPVSNVDPDGRNPVLVAMAISGGVQAYMTWRNGGTNDEIASSAAKGVIVGGLNAATGGVTGAAMSLHSAFNSDNVGRSLLSVGASIGLNALASQYSPMGVLRGTAYGGLTGAAASGITAAIAGNDVKGALGIGAVSGALMGGYAAGWRAFRSPNDLNVWSGNSQRIGRGKFALNNTSDRTNSYATEERPYYSEAYANRFLGLVRNNKDRRINATVTNGVGPIDPTGRTIANDQSFEPVPLTKNINMSNYVGPSSGAFNGFISPGQIITVAADGVIIFTQNPVGPVTMAAVGVFTIPDGTQQLTITSGGIPLPNPITGRIDIGTWYTTINGYFK